jgi:calcineurin-like phosphoesterase family protein
VATNTILNCLNGIKIRIAGNHDAQVPLKACFIESHGYSFEIAHKPEDCSHSHNIHGHEHIKHGERIKIKDGSVFINVNTELWDYKPVSMETIIKLIKKNEEGKSL